MDPTSAKVQFKWVFIVLPTCMTLFYIQIPETEIDFWNTKFEILRLKHQERIYPPRVRMTVDAPNAEPRSKLLIEFDGCSSDSQLSMEILFPLSN